MSRLDRLLAEVRCCSICKDLPLGPNPIVQASATSRILIAGQAPGRIIHAKNVPFDDPSGNTLRHWMGIDRMVFYDATRVACLPMGFCYPGTGKGGDHRHGRNVLRCGARDCWSSCRPSRYIGDWPIRAGLALALLARLAIDRPGKTLAEFW